MNATSHSNEVTEPNVNEEKRKAGRPKGSQGPRIAMDKTSYLLIADQEKQVFAKQLVRLQDIVNGLNNAPDFSPAVMGLLQKFLDDSQGTINSARSMIKAIQKRGATSLDDQKRALKQGTLRLVKSDSDE